MEDKYKMTSNPENFELFRENDFDIKFDFGTEEEKEVLSMSVKYADLHLSGGESKIVFRGFIGLPEILYRLSKQPKINFTYSLHTKDYKNNIYFRYTAEPKDLIVENCIDSNAPLNFTLIIKYLIRCSF